MCVHSTIICNRINNRKCTILINFHFDFFGLFILFFFQKISPKTTATSTKLKTKFNMEPKTNQLITDINQPIAKRKATRTSRLRNPPPKYNVVTSDDDDDDDDDDNNQQQVQKARKKKIITSKLKITKRGRGTGRTKRTRRIYEKDECIWAKSNEFPWWPAKIIRKIPNKQKYLVNFFFKDSNNEQQNDDDNKYVSIYI